MAAKIHSLADVSPLAVIGDETRIWQFVVVLAGAKIGNGCNLCAHTFVEGDVVIGDNVTLKSGVFVWDGIRLGNNVFIGPNVTFTNDRDPRSKIYPNRFDVTVVEDNASIGANATLLPGLRVGSNALIGAGSVVTRDVAPNTVVVGNPARFLKIREPKDGLRW